MYVIWGSMAGILLYLEFVYHLSGFGLSSCNPIYTIALILAWSGAQTMLVGVLKGRGKKIIYYFFLWIAVFWYIVQLVYLRIFKQPLLWEAIFRGGGDALTNYWREALEGFLGTLPFIALFLLPPIVEGIVLHRLEWKFPDFSGKQLLATTIICVLGVVGGLTTMEVGRRNESLMYEEYSEFYNPLGIAESMGVLPLLQRDTVLSLSRFTEELWKQLAENPSSVSGDILPVEEVVAKNVMSGAMMQDNIGEDEIVENVNNNIEQKGGGAYGQSEEDTENRQDGPVIRPQQFELDFDQLYALADNDKQKWLAEYIQGLEPVTTNAYTGMFEGYNLIYLTAEAFSTYAIREDLTPTLYRLANSGFAFENYYVPLWQTSTSDGEYINCTGLIPDGQFSMRKSGSNHMAYSLPCFFAKEGVTSYAYHNNSLSYYDRNVTHFNLGYDFKGCKLGSLSQEEWGTQVFTMEHPNAWPASDLEMMQGTVAEYLEQDRFHVYYMTVSGHMNYNFSGNAMASKNREAVAGMEQSEAVRAYLACNIELDKALEYLLEQLEEAGQLEKTVICLSADHYPYGLNDEQYEELAGQSLKAGKDMYRNSLILWNVGLEDAPVTIHKVCGSMDIVPTLLNLFGFSYDSRMYAGRDILSEEEGMVIFNDRSFVTDGVIYNRSGKKTIWCQDAEGKDIIPDEQKDTYLEEKKQEVKERYQFSAYVLQEDYYADIEQSLNEHRTVDEQITME